MTNNNPANTEKDNNYFTPQRTPGNQKLSAAAKPFWWPKLTKEIQNKCDECIPCEMTGVSLKPQIPMSEINYLPPTDKPNEKFKRISSVQLDLNNGDS